MRIIAIALSALTLSSTAVANQSSDCPGAASIKAVGLNTAYIVDKNSWQAAYHPSNKYGTPVEWRFGMAGKNANTKSAALKIAQTELNSLQYIMGPIVDRNVRSCYYKTGNNLYGIAVTPPDGM